jgi:hypothetical protein
MCSSNLDNLLCMSSFYSGVIDETFGGLSVVTFFGPIWSNNNNTPLFYIYHKFQITRNKYSKNNYANCKLRTFKNLNLDFVLLDDLPSGVSLKFWPF